MLRWVNDVPRNEAMDMALDLRTYCWKMYTTMN
jgi:hypothetical protein